MWNKIKPVTLRIAAAGALLGLAVAAAPASAAVSLSINIGGPPVAVMPAAPAYPYARTPQRWEQRPGWHDGRRYVDRRYHERAPYYTPAYPRPVHGPRGGYAQP